MEKLDRCTGIKDTFSWSGKRVWVTGHTGFKGAWLCAWLIQEGAVVLGTSLPKPARESMVWQQLEPYLKEKGLEDYRADIADWKHEDDEKVARFQPEIVFHLAAQAIVLDSYQNMKETWGVNVMGTLAVLDSAALSGAKAIVVITTDKCYENKEWVWAYRETDELGGKDPYSASKAACELLVKSWRESKGKALGVHVATARAGNVIGGGDNAPHRLVPDVLKAWSENRSVLIKNPEATRPFQHVLEPLSAYVRLGQFLMEKVKSHQPVSSEVYNIGPEGVGEKTVKWMVEKLAQAWGEKAEWTLPAQSEQSKQEAHWLKLDSSWIQHRLNWRSTWCIEKGLRATVEWEKARKKGQDMVRMTLGQIEAYRKEGLKKAERD